MQFGFFQGVLTPTVSRAYLLTQTHNYFIPDKIVLAVLPATVLDCFNFSEKPQKTPCVIFSQVQKNEVPRYFQFPVSLIVQTYGQLNVTCAFFPPFASHYFSALNIINIFKMSQICMHQLTTMISLPPSPRYCSVFPKKYSV